MILTAGNEDEVIKYYERFWTKTESWWDDEHTLGIHLGYHERGARSLPGAVLNMNDVAWKLLHLREDVPGQILDAGCGVGGTSIYLARKYPRMSFTGITIVSKHIEMAKLFAQKHNVAANTRFLEQNFCHTSFPDESFDGIIAIESVVYAQRQDDLIAEFYRLLKPGGHVAILDGFRTVKPIPDSMKKIYQIWLKGRALRELESANSWASSMSQKGFRDVLMQDVSSHIFYSYFLGMLVDSARLIPSLMKSLLISGKGESDDGKNNYLVTAIASALLVINGGFKYYSISATK